MSLSAAKLAAIVGNHLGERIAPDAPVELSAGSALIVGNDAWVLNDQDDGRALGPALAWAGRQPKAERLNLIVSTQASLFAYQAAAFSFPIKVYQIGAKSLTSATAEPPEVRAELHADLAQYRALFVEAGARAVIEQNMLIAEVLGLEVARAFMADGLATLEIGIGRLDREAHQLINSQRPKAEILIDAVSLVKKYRHIGAAPHPLNRIARERFVRSLLIDAPELVGAKELKPIEGLRIAPDLRTPWPAMATGADISDRPLIVACSVGVDLALVPMAGEVRMLDGRGARLLFAMPARDLHPITTMLAGFLIAPVEMVPLDFV